MSVGRYFAPSFNRWISGYVKPSDASIEFAANQVLKKQADFDRTKSELNKVGIDFKYIQENDPLRSKFDQTAAASIVAKEYQDRVMGIKNKLLEEGDISGSAQDIIDFNNRVKQDKRIDIMNKSAAQYDEYKKAIGKLGADYGVWRDQYINNPDYKGMEDATTPMLFTYSTLDKTYDQSKAMNDFIGDFKDDAYKQGRITMLPSGEWKATEGNEGYVSEKRVKQYIEDNINRYLSEDYGKDYALRLNYQMKDDPEYKKMTEEQKSKYIASRLQEDLYQVAKVQIHSKPMTDESFQPFPKDFNFGGGGGSATTDKPLGVSTIAGNTLTQFDSYDKFAQRLGTVTSGIDQQNKNLYGILQEAKRLGMKLGIKGLDRVSSGSDIMKILSNHKSNPQIKAYSDQYANEYNKYQDMLTEQTNLRGQQKAVAEFSIEEAARDVSGDIFKNKVEKDVAAIYKTYGNNKAQLNLKLKEFYTNGKNRYKGGDLEDYYGVVKRINEFGHNKAMEVAKKDMNDMTADELDLYRMSSVSEISNTDVKTPMGRFISNLNQALSINSADGMDTGGSNFDYFNKIPGLKQRILEMAGAGDSAEIKIKHVSPAYGQRTTTPLLSVTFSVKDEDKKWQVIKVPLEAKKLITSGYNGLLSDLEKTTFQTADDNTMANRLIGNNRIGTNLSRSLNNYETQLKGNHVVIKDEITGEDLIIVGSTGDGPNSSSTSMRMFKGGKGFKNRDELYRMIKNGDLEEIKYEQNGESLPIMDNQSLSIAYGDYIRKNTQNQENLRKKVR